MKVVTKIGKCCLLLLIGISIAVLWVYCHGFLPHELYGSKVISPEAERFGGMVTLGVLFAAPALPIYRLFSEYTVLASMLVGWVPLALSVTLAFQTNKVVDNALSLKLATVEGVLCWLAIILGAWTIKTISKPRL